MSVSVCVYSESGGEKQGFCQELKKHTGALDLDFGFQGQSEEQFKLGTVVCCNETAERTLKNL